MFKFLLNFIPGVGPMLSAGSSFFAAHWKVFCVGAMVGMLAYQNFSARRYLVWIPTIPYLQQQIVKDEAEIKKLSNDLDIAAMANMMLSDSIAEQNQTIGQWKSISEDLQKKNELLATQLISMRKANDKKVSDILKSQTPTTCEASIDYLRTMRTQLTWSNSK